MFNLRLFLAILLLVSFSKTFSQAHPYGAQTKQAVGTGDFNADGIVDVLWHNQTTGELSIWILGLNGAVVREQTISQQCDLASACAPHWQVIGIGNSNGDGMTDILWHNPATGEFSTWLLDINGTVIGNQAPSHNCALVSTCTPNWTVVGTGSFNADGITDILWQNSTTGELSTWLLDASGAITGAHTFSTPCDFTSTCKLVGTGDFNADGVTDVLWHNPTTNELPIWLLDVNGVVVGKQAFSQKCDVASACTVGWQIVGTGDFNGNGSTDLFWHNASAGESAIVLMDPNGTIAQSAYNQQEYSYSTYDTDGNGGHSKGSYSSSSSSSSSSSPSSSSSSYSSSSSSSSSSSYSSSSSQSSQ